MTNGNCNIYEQGVAGEMRAWSTYTLYCTPAEPYTYEDLAECYVRAVDAGEVLFRLSMADAVVDFEKGALAWSLTQEQTGSVPVGQRVAFYFDPLTNDGERGDIPPMVVEITKSGVDGEIPISESEVDNE